MILAALDPGSARCALVIARTWPAGPITLLHHEIFPVGHLEPLPEPVITKSKAGKTWTRTMKRVHSPAEESAVVSAIATAVVTHGVDRLLIEASAPYLSDRATIGALRAQVREVSIAAGITKRLEDRLGLLGVAVELVPRVTWLAAIRRYLASRGTPLPKDIGRGWALDPLIREHLPALFTSPPLPEAPTPSQLQSEPPAAKGEDVGERPRSRSLPSPASPSPPASPDALTPPVAPVPAPESEDAGERPQPPRAPTLSPDLRDAACLLLSATLEIPASTRRAPRARAATPPPGAPSSGSPAPPPGSPQDASTPPAPGDAPPARRPRAPRRARAPGELPAALTPAALAQREEGRLIRQTRRQLLGCTCPPDKPKGRHPATCPCHRPKAAPVAPAGYGGVRSL